MIDPILQIVVVALKQIDWTVVAEKLRSRRAGDYDLVATDPEGHRFVVEVKSGDGTAHFSQVAQVEALASDLELEEPGSTPTPVLLTTLQVPPSIAAAADDVGVEIVKAEGTDEEVANALVRFLKEKSSHESS